MDRETKLKLLKSIGFADNKCEETLKNDAVSQKLAELIQHVILSWPIYFDKNL